MHYILMHVLVRDYEISKASKNADYAHKTSPATIVGKLFLLRGDGHTNKFARF